MIRILLAACLLAGMVVPAIAHHDDRQRIMVRGEIVSIDYRHQTMVVRGHHGDRDFRALVFASDDTLIVDPRSDRRLSFDDLEVGDGVKIRGHIVRRDRHDFAIFAHLIVRHQRDDGGDGR